MKRIHPVKKLSLVLGALLMVLVMGAWQGEPKASQKQYSNDTIPSKKIKDIDEALNELEKSRIELEKTISNKDWEKEIRESMKEIDGDRIKADIEKAMKEIDAEKIRSDIQKAMSEVNFEKIKSEIEKSMASIDSDKMKAEIEKAVKEIDIEKMQANMEASLAKIDMEKVKAEMERIRTTDFKKIEEDMKKLGPEIEKSMAGARESIEKAKKELTGYKDFINDLDKEGLINKDKTYTIEYKKGDLTINGQKQSDKTVKKFSKFLKDHKDFTITKDADQFNIEND